MKTSGPNEPMTDSEMFKGLREARSGEKADRRILAADWYPALQAECQANGLTLRKNTTAHYTLIGPDWRLEVYPGNRRIWRQPGTKTIRLNLPKDWHMGHVVEAAIHATKQPTQAGE